MGKQSQTITRVYGNTTTSNPYATASTNNSGTTTSFVPGSALETIYNTVNKNMNSLLNDYLNPNLNSTTNQAKLNSFVNTLNNTTAANLENNIINPLSNRNMVRSSQATDLYKNLATSNTNATADFVNELLASSQDNSAKMISNLLSAYMKGYDVISDMQKQSLNTSKGNATTSTKVEDSGSSSIANAGNVVDIISKVISLFGNKSM